MSISGGARFRADGRTPGQLRPISIQLDVQKWASASCIIRCGDTHVLCAATIEDRIPPHLRGKGTGWVTAEYSMLPGATSERSQRESVKGRQGGRTHEIQRLIGRSLRGVVDTAALGERTVSIDCDVLQADGGTRCASITGGWLVLAIALRRDRPAAGAPRPARRRQRGHRGRRRCCSTSITRRTRARRSTSTWSPPTPAPTSRCRARPRASPSTASRWMGCWSSPMVASSSSSRHSRRPSSGPGRRQPPRPSGDRSGTAPVAGRDRVSPQAGRAARAAGPAAGRSCSRFATSGADGPPNRSRTRAPSAATRSSRRATTPRSRACPPSPTTRGWRWTRSTVGRGAHPALCRRGRHRRRQQCPAAPRAQRCAHGAPWRPLPLRAGLPWSGARRRGRGRGTARPTRSPAAPSRGASRWGCAAAAALATTPCSNLPPSPLVAAPVGQLTAAEKNRVSHRARAARSMARALRDLGW